MLERMDQRLLLPLSLQLLKTHLRLDHGQDDELLQSLILTATQWVEEVIGKRLLYQTYKETFFDVTGEKKVKLSQAPFSKIVEISAYKEQEFLENFRGYKLDKTMDKATLQVEKDLDKLVVLYEVGMACGSNELPPVLKHALLLLAAELYEKGAGVDFTQSHPVFVLLKPFIQKRLR